MTIIAPSILAADFGRLSEEIQKVDATGADWLHLDVMDGTFVPPITFGDNVVRAARTVTQKTLDVHLMVQNPEPMLESFAAAGADIITVHAEVCPHLNYVVERIHRLGKKAGVAINPATPLSMIYEILPDIQLLLIMTVNPGWGGQKFISSTEKKIAAARALIQDTGMDIALEVDGGINVETAARAVSAGANVLVAGTAIFKSENYEAAIAKLRGQ